MKIITFFMLLFLGFLKTADASDWVCSQTASQRQGESYLVCGIGESSSEQDARTKAYKAAQKEFEIVCNSSADCRNHDYISTPLRNSCKKNRRGSYRCLRAIRFKILEKPKEHMTEYDRERIDQELEATKQKYDEAKEVFEKQKKIEELQQKIKNKNFGDSNNQIKHPVSRWGMTGISFNSLQGINDSNFNPDFIGFNFGAEYLNGRWTDQVVFILGFSDELYIGSLWALKRYYFVRELSVGIGGGVNYADFREGDSPLDVAAILSFQYSLSKNFSIDAFYSASVFSKSATLFSGAEVSSLNRLGISLNILTEF